MAFKLPKKEKLFIELRKDGKGFQVEGELKDTIYESLSNKNIVRARTLFSTDHGNYQVLDYEKHGESANICIRKISK